MAKRPRAERRPTSAQAPPTGQPASRRPETARFPEWAAGLLAVAAALRLLWLTKAPFQHDEAIYSIFSLNFATYNFDPVYHGPVLYHIVRLFFNVLGDSDFSARLVAVVLGMGTLALVAWPGRRWLGSRGALFALGLMAISPAMVTYHRRILHDPLVQILTLGAIFCFQSGLVLPVGTWRSRKAWIGVVALLTLFIATKANSFFVVAMLFSFWVARWLRPIRWDAIGLKPEVLRVAPFLPAILVGGIVVFWAVYVPVEKGNLGQFLLAALMVGTALLIPRLGAPLFAFTVVSLASTAAFRDGTTIQTARNEIMLIAICFAACLVLWEWLRSGNTDPKKTAAAPAFTWPKLDWVAIGLSLAAGAFLFVFFFGHGYIWWKNYGAIPQYLQDVKQAMPKMLDYWGGQQKAPRLPGRHDFYLPLMIIYELPIVIAAIFGILRATRHRTPFTDLCLWWGLTSYALYSMANEKVPWLLSHIMMPLILLAGWWLAYVSADLKWRRLAAVLGFVGFVFLLRNTCATNFERAVDHREPMFYAFTAESFKDVFFRAIEESKGKPGGFWIYNAWPPSWYMRHADKEFPGVPVHYDETMPKNQPPFRMVVCTDAEWSANAEAFKGWHKWTWENGQVVKDSGGENPHILNWPRASWESLRPDRFLTWWWTREAKCIEGKCIEVGNPEGGFAKGNEFITEWSHIPAIVATPP